MRRLPAGIAFAVALCLARPAHADPEGDNVRARELFFQALEGIHDEEWAAAERDLRLSQSLVPRASTLYNLALVTFHQGRLLESLTLATPLAEGSSEGEDEKYREYARALVDRISRDAPRVDLTVTPPEAEVTVDGRAMAGGGSERSLMLDPGPRRITVSARGYDEQSISLVLGMRERRSVGVALRREPAESRAAPAPVRSRPLAPAAAPRPAAPAPQETAPNIAPWILAGSGGALLVASVVTGLLAKDANDDFVGECPDLRNCDRRLESLQTRVRTLGTVTDVLLVTGGIAVAGGITWWLVLPRSGTARGAASGVHAASGVQVCVGAAF